jgi:DNA-binding response OmpR family regulator
MVDKQKKILLVEDEKNIRDAVAAYLEHDNYDVTPANDGVAALELFNKDEFDLVILDLMLPRLPGEVVCRTIRETSSIPIIMLTAKGGVEDRILGLELGADDYLVKPFSPRELVARVRALLRRSLGGDELSRDKIDLGSIVIDTAGHKVFKNNELIEMTASEYKLLVTLARSPGRVFTRMELVKKVLGYDFDGYERTIDSHVKNLRAKLDDDPKNPRWLFTVHGVGYRFELDSVDK